MHSYFGARTTMSEVILLHQAVYCWKVVFTGLSRWGFLPGLVVLYAAWINKGWISRLQPNDIYDKARILCLRDFFFKHSFHFRAKLREEKQLFPHSTDEKEFTSYLRNDCLSEEGQRMEKSTFESDRQPGIQFLVLLSLVIALEWIINPTKPQFLYLKNGIKIHKNTYLSTIESEKQNKLRSRIETDS